MATSAGEGPDGPSVVSATAATPPARERFWNLPNTITMLRMGVVPVLLLLPIADDKGSSQLIAWCFIVGAVTDLVDGWLARRGQASGATNPPTILHEG